MAAVPSSEELLLLLFLPSIFSWSASAAACARPPCPALIAFVYDSVLEASARCVSMPPCVLECLCVRASVPLRSQDAVAHLSSAPGNVGSGRLMLPTTTPIRPHLLVVPPPKLRVRCSFSSDTVRNPDCTLSVPRLLTRRLTFPSSSSFILSPASSENSHTREHAHLLPAPPPPRRLGFHAAT